MTTPDKAREALQAARDWIDQKNWPHDDPPILQQIDEALAELAAPAVAVEPIGTVEIIDALAFIHVAEGNEIAHGQKLYAPPPAVAPQGEAPAVNKAWNRVREEAMKLSGGKPIPGILAAASELIDVVQDHEHAFMHALKAGAPAVAQRGGDAALRSALERVLWNFKLNLAGKPVRDATETIAEAEAALASPPAPPAEAQAADFLPPGFGLEHWRELTRQVSRLATALGAPRVWGKAPTTALSATIALAADKLAAPAAAEAPATVKDSLTDGAADGWRWRFKEGKDRTWRHVEKLPGFDPNVVEAEPMFLGAAEARVALDAERQRCALDIAFELHMTGDPTWDQVLEHLRMAYRDRCAQLSADVSRPRVDAARALDAEGKSQGGSA